MARPRLTEFEKQQRKRFAAETRASERAKQKASRKAFQEQIKLRQKREKAFRRLLPHNPFSLEYCHDLTVGLRADENVTVGYEQLLEVASIFGSTKLNLTAETDTCYDTYGGCSDTSRLIIVIEDVDWREIDNA